MTLPQELKKALNDYHKATGQPVMLNLVSSTSRVTKPGLFVMRTRKDIYTVAECFEHEERIHIHDSGHDFIMAAYIDGLRDNYIADAPLLAASVTRLI